MKVIEQEDISLNTDSTREFVQQSITTLFILSEPDFGDPQELGNQTLLSLPRDWQPGINLVHCIPLQTSKQAVKDKWSLCIFIQYTSHQWGPEMHKAEVHTFSTPPHQGDRDVLLQTWAQRLIWQAHHWWGCQAEGVCLTSVLTMHRQRGKSWNHSRTGSRI